MYGVSLCVCMCVYYFLVLSYRVHVVCFVIPLASYVTHKTWISVLQRGNRSAFSWRFDVVFTHSVMFPFL